MNVATVEALCVMVYAVAGLGEDRTPRDFSVETRPAARIQLPGVRHEARDPDAPGEVDCSSPSHWDGDTLYMFCSAGHPFRSSGRDLFHLSRPSQRVAFDNEAGWTMGGRWIESTFKAEGGLRFTGMPISTPG